MSSSITTQQHIPIELPKFEPLAPSFQTTQSLSSKSEMTATKEQKTSQQFQTFKLEHQMPEIPMPKPLSTKIEDSVIEKQTEFEICHPPGFPYQESKEETKSESTEGIETSSISKQSSLQYFVKKIKEGETTAPKEVSIPEPIKPEIYQKFESVTESHKETEIPITMEEQKVPPPVPSKPGPSASNIKSFSQQTTKEFISQPVIQQFKSYSSEIVQDFGLTPEPPAEILYSPRQEGFKKHEQFTEKVKQISESQKQLPPHEVPIGAVQILPQQSKQFEEKKEFSEKIERSYQQSSFESSSSYSRSFEKSSTKESGPKLEIGRSSVPSSPYSTLERQVHSRPLSAQPTEPSFEAIQMEKQWAHSFNEMHHEKPWPVVQPEELKVKPSWSVQSTLEKKWTPIETKTEKLTRTEFVSKPIPKQHYIAEVSNLGNIVDHQSMSNESFVKTEIVEDRNVRPSEIVKSWPPPPVSSYTKSLTSIDSLPIRPVSVQDITDEVVLEPGPPPEIRYAQPPPKERRQSYVETMEQELEKNLEPSKVPPCAVRTIPLPKEWVVAPPLPPKQVIQQAPPLPAKPYKFTEPPKKSKEIISVPFKKFPELEPFPFKPDPHKPKPPKVGPPPTPSKFIKGKFTDSDYESDIESSRIAPRWKPAMSDTEEPTYRRVRAPQLIHIGRSRSQECEPLPPSKFDHPPHFEGPPRPDINFDEFRTSRVASQVKKFSKHTRAQDTVKPVTTPVYVTPVKRPESPKHKAKPVLDGYMADTDEPFRQKFISSEYSSEEKSEYRQFKSSENFQETSSQKTFTAKPRVTKFPAKKQHTSTVSFKKVGLDVCSRNTYR